MLVHELVVGADDLAQIQPPLVHVGNGPAVGDIVGRPFLGVASVEVGDDLPHQGRRLAADVALPVHQQLIEETEGLYLLGDAQIDAVRGKDSQPGPQPLPAGFSPGLLQKSGKAPLVGQTAHEDDVVGHAPVFQDCHRLLRLHQGHVFGRRRRGKAAGEGGIHPQGEHIVLKVPEFGIDKGIAGALGLGDIVQLGEDHIEGLGEGGDAGDLPAVLPLLLLDPEVGVNKDQGLHRQVVQFQVPYGVVGGHIADVRHMAAAEPQVGVVVVEIGHPLPGPAAELADVVAGGAGGYQGQVHVYPCFFQVPGHGKGHKVDAGNMLQGAEGGGLQAQAHHFIQKFPAAAALELAEAVPVGAVRHLLLSRQVDLPQGVGGQKGPLRVQQHLEQGQEKYRPGPVAAVALLVGGVGEHGPPGKVIGKKEPPLFRLRSQAAQVLPAQGQYVGAAQAAAVKEGGKALNVVLRLQQGGEYVPAGLHPVYGGPGGKAAQEAGVHLADAFPVHGGRSPFLGDRIPFLLLCTNPGRCARKSFPGVVVSAVRRQFSAHRRRFFGEKGTLHCPGQALFSLSLNLTFGHIHGK